MMEQMVTGKNKDLNKIINLIGDKIREKFIPNIKEYSVLQIIRDKSHVKQLTSSYVLSYLNKVKQK